MPALAFIEFRTALDYWAFTNFRQIVQNHPTRLVLQCPAPPSLQEYIYSIISIDQAIAIESLTRPLNREEEPLTWTSEVVESFALLVVQCGTGDTSHNCCTSKYQLSLHMIFAAFCYGAVAVVDFWLLELSDWDTTVINLQQVWMVAASNVFDTINSTIQASNLMVSCTVARTTAPRDTVYNARLQEQEDIDFGPQGFATEFWLQLFAIFCQGTKYFGLTIVVQVDKIRLYLLAFTNLLKNCSKLKIPSREVQDRPWSRLVPSLVVIKQRLPQVLLDGVLKK